MPHDWADLLAPGLATDWFRDFAAAPPLHRDARWRPANAWWLAELARLVYRSDDRQRVLDAVGLQERFAVEIDGTAALLLHRQARPACAVLVFRGTASLRDWLVNVRAVRRSWQGPGRVHYGFRRALHRVWSRLEPHLDDAPDAFFTGHSLGGALATLAAALRPPLATYTFGAPKVGDRTFAAALPNGVHRVVNGRDLVPELPPSPRGGYVHGGEPHHLGPAPAADRAAFAAACAQLAARRSRLAPHPALLDHAPRGYVEQLRRLVAP